MFQTEMKYFQEHQENLVKQYNGKILVIKGTRVVGAYDSNIEAFNEAIKNTAGLLYDPACAPGQKHIQYHQF